MGDLLAEAQRLLGPQLNYTRELLVVALILGRTMPIIILVPFIGGKMVPATVKMGLGVLLTLIVWPLARVSMRAEIPVDPVSFLLLMTAQILVGFAIGFVTSHIFWAMEMAGRIIDTVRGSSMAEVMVPTSGTRATPFGDLFFQLMIIVFVVTGGHAIFFDAYFFSFAQLPLDEGVRLDGGAFEPFFDMVLRLTGEILLLATLLAAPVVAATFITDVVFGILNRVAPQLNAYFMSMPVKAMAGIILVFVALDPFVTRLRDFVVWTLEALERTLELLSFTGT